MRTKTLLLAAVLVAASVFTRSVQAATTVAVKYYPGPSLSSPHALAYLTNILNYAVSGTAPTGDINSPAFADTRANVLKVEDMTVSSTVPLWQGSFSPGAAYSAQRGGSTYYIVVITNPQNTTLGEHLIIQDSNDRFGGVLQNTLAVTQNMSGFTYDLWRPGFRADGSRITSGPSTQVVVKTIIIGVCVSYVADNQAAYDNVDAYVGMQSPPFTITTRVSAGGTALAAQRWSVVPIAPPLTINPGIGNTAVLGIGGDPLESYTLQSATALSTWADWIKIRGATNLVVATTGSQKFYRFAGASTTSGGTALLAVPHATAVPVIAIGSGGVISAAKASPLRVGSSR